jgi:hypothetical protein
MGTTYKPAELRIVMLRSGSIPPIRVVWGVELWFAATSSPQDRVLAQGTAETYKLACAAAGEAFDRLTAPKVEVKSATQPCDGCGKDPAIGLVGDGVQVKCFNKACPAPQQGAVRSRPLDAIDSWNESRCTVPREPGELDIMQRMKEYQQKTCGPDWQAEAQRATQQYNDLLATVTAALAELDAFPGKYDYGLGVCDAIKVFRRHLTPKPTKDPAIVRALQEALRAYREVSHDRVNGDDVKAMAAAIAAYETEKAKNP